MNGYIKRKDWVTAALFGLLVTALPAQAANATSPEEKITVTVSPEVREQLQKLNPGERKKMEAAIRIGNRYAPHHFDGTAYARNDDQQEKLWQKNIRPLVALLPNRNENDWYDPGEAGLAQKLEINGMRVGTYVVCPEPELVSARVASDHFDLMYRTKIIGMWRSSIVKLGGPTLDDYIQNEFILDKNNEDDEVLITVNKDNRVSRIDAKYALESTIPDLYIEMYEAYIKWPPRKLYQGAEHAEQETEEQARARIPQYKKYIELIKSVEAAACGSASGNSNQTQNRE